MGCFCLKQIGRTVRVEKAVCYRGDVGIIIEFERGTHKMTPSLATQSLHNGENGNLA